MQPPPRLWRIQGINFYQLPETMSAYFRQPSANDETAPEPTLPRESEGQTSGDTDLKGSNIINLFNR